MDVLGEFIYKRTYARFLEDEGRREEWPETVDRYCNWLFDDPKIPEKVKIKSKERLLSQEVLGSMRATWTAGRAASLDSSVIYNCAFLVIDNIFAFSECLYLLMCGCGVGFSCENRHLSKLPEVKYQRNMSTYTHIVGDSRLGWKQALDKGVEAWWNGRDITYDFSFLRPLGAPLRTMGGRSSGGGVLIQLLSYARELIMSCQGRRMTPFEAHSLMCEVASIVIVGGTRRSALLSMSDLIDQEMRLCKTGNFHKRLFGANNSAVYLKKPNVLTFLDEFTALAKSGTGERGIVSLYSARKNAPKRRDSSKIEGLNPCFRGDMRLLTAEGYKTFKELAQYKTVALLNKDGEISEGKVWANPELQEIIEVRFKDNWRDSIFCTSEHKFMLQDGSKCEAWKLRGKKVKWYTEDYPEGREVEDTFASKTVEVVYDFNEPLTNWGVVEGAIVSNCGEVTLRPREMCNLVECIVKATDTFEDLRSKLTTAAWLGVLQSGKDYFPALHEDWHNNSVEERLVGVSLSGQMDNPTLLTPDILKLLRQHVVNTCKKAAKIMEYNMPASCTTVKPAGSTSQLVNSSAGIHPRYAPYYIRNVMISTTDPLFLMLKDQGVPHFFAKSNGDSSAILQFPVASPKGAITRHDLSALKQLEWYLKVATNYTEMCPSATVYVAEDEWISTANWVYENFNNLNGLTFFPKESNGHKYEWLPFQEINEGEYDKALGEFPEIHYDELSRYEKVDCGEGNREIACSGGACEI